MRTRSPRHERDGSIEEAFARGTEDALRDAYERYGSAVYSLARSCLTSDQDAEDVTQATFVSAWNGRRTFDLGEGSLRGWLMGIARRRCIDRLRTLDRDRRVIGAFAVVHGTGPSQRPDYSTAVIDRLLVGARLDELPSAQRDVLRLTFFEDMTQVQISERTGMPLGTVKSHVRRGLSSLREVWERGDETR